MRDLHTAIRTYNAKREADTEAATRARQLIAARRLCRPNDADKSTSHYWDVVTGEDVAAPPAHSFTEEAACRRHDHECANHAVPYTNGDGPLGHGWECGRCGEFLQAG